MKASSLPDPGKGLWIFGGPFAGKTTIARAHPETVKEFDDVFDSLNEALPAEERVDRKAWRTTHPQHGQFNLLRKRVIEALVDHAQQGGVSVNHDPCSEVSVPTLYLRPHRNELKERIASYVSKTGDTHRELASQHWEGKAQDRGWDKKYPALVNSEIDALLKGLP